MKPTIQTLKLGDFISAQVIENVGDGESILSFHGDLLRVKNESPQPLVVGDTVMVRVVTVRPLQFQVVTKANGSLRPDKMNICV